MQVVATNLVFRFMFSSLCSRHRVGPKEFWSRSGAIRTFQSLDRNAILSRIFFVLDPSRVFAHVQPGAEQGEGKCPSTHIQLRDLHRACMSQATWPILPMALN